MTKRRGPTRVTFSSADVTSTPFTDTVAFASGTVRGIVTRMSASPPVTIDAGEDSTATVKSWVVAAADTDAPPSANPHASAAHAWQCRLG